ncbi:MAG: DUF72 domain-containing protein [Thioalkalivibrio sp.]|nr:MAG: DUF72 domain-containing protein [Thioalkalivibrio sp.]
MSHAYIGTSGWNYRAWKDDFYRGVPQRAWLAHCARHFSGLEINGTFYRLPEADTVQRWAEQTPEGFGFAIKGSRYVTHLRRLKEAADSVALLRSRMQPMGDRLRAVVWQLPANFRLNQERLEAFTGALEAWPEVGHAIEFRHSSWFTDAVAAHLDAAGVGICQSDAPDWPCWETVAGSLVYCRLHGHTRLYASAYSGRSLDRWAGSVQQWLAEGREVHVYFDNDSEGAAPRDAQRLLERVGSEREFHRKG